MRTYLELLEDVLNNGDIRQDRTGVGTRAVFGRQMRFDLSEGFPLLTTKKMHWRSIVVELIWFLAGKSNVGWLQDRKVRIWDEWADENGDLGPIYGVQWRSFPKPNGESVDQICQVLRSLKEDPSSRRHIVVAWNPSQISEMALPPCHCLFQFFVAKGKLSCQLYQRSADIFLGLPFNIASYALLTHMFANQLGLGVGDFVWTGGDIHLYGNHIEQAREQLSRTPKKLPSLALKQGLASLFDYKFEDIVLHEYQSQPAIKAPIAT